MSAAVGYADIVGITDGMAAGELAMEALVSKLL
jgi:hypothetical protein